VTTLFALLGIAAGHGVRRLTPRLAGVGHEGPIFRLPWVELFGGLSFGLCAATVGWPYSLFALLLLAVTSTDFLFKLVPDRVTYPGTAVGLVFSAAYPERINAFLGQGAWGQHNGFLVALLGAAAGFAFLEAVRRLMGGAVGVEVMGMGDSKLLMMAGAFLGPKAIVLSLVPALAAGLVIGVPYTQLAKSPHLPFGPALAIGAFVTLLWGRDILDLWFGFARWTRELPPAATLTISIVLLAVAVGLMLRVRKRRAEYTRRIEEDYDELEER